MAKLSKCFLLVLLIILLFSCKKNDTNISKNENNEEYFSRFRMAEENRIAIEEREKQDKIDVIEFDKKMNSDDTIAAEIEFAFINRKPNIGTGKYSSPKIGNVSEIETIMSAQGYYIQQPKEYPSIYNRSPEILVLFVKDKNVYIKEIDLVRGKIITRNEILLQFDGITFSHNNTKLETQDGKIKIIYAEHTPEQPWRFPFEYKAPFSFVGNLDDPINEDVRKLTSDYLETFTGRYIFDSGKIISSNVNKSFFPMRYDAIQIEYNQKLKCLTILFSEASHICIYNISASDFIETDNERIFYWANGEGPGYIDIRLYFYKNGIAFNCDCVYANLSVYEDGEMRTVYERHVIFFRKET